MTTKLFARNQSITIFGNSYLTANTNQGAAVTSIGTATTTAAAEVDFVTRWSSGRAPAGGTTISGIMTINMWGVESAMTVNAGPRVRVYKMNTSGNLTEIGGSPADDGVEYGTAFAAQNWTLSPTSFSLAENERIVYGFLNVPAGGTMATGTVSMSYNGATAANGDTYLQTNETISFKAEALDLRQVAFRGKNDDGNVTTATWITTQNTNWSQPANTIFRLRTAIQEAGQTILPTNQEWCLQFNRNGGAYANVGRPGLPNNFTNLANSTFVAEADSGISGQLTGTSGNFSSLIGSVVHETTFSTGILISPAGNYHEDEWVLQFDGSHWSKGDTCNLKVFLTVDAITIDALPTITLATDLRQSQFRGRNDDGNETTATWKATQNTNWTQTTDTNFRVRFVLDEIGVSTSSQFLGVQYNKNSAGWNTVDTTTAVVRGAISPFLTGGTEGPTTQQLSNGLGTYAAGIIDDDDASLFSQVVAGGTNKEYEFCLKIIGTDVLNGDTIQLRLAPFTDTITYSQIPSLTVSKATANVHLSHYRLRNDDGTEATATWRAATDTSAHIILNKTFRARFVLQEKADVAAANQTFKLQYSVGGAAYADVGSFTPIFSTTSGQGISDGTATTQQLTGTGTFIAGTFDNDGNSENILITANNNTEIEYCLRLDSTTLVAGNTITLKIVGTNDTIISDVTPTILVDKPVIDAHAFRFRNDDGNETTATWIAAQNTTITQPIDAPFRIRFLLQETTGNTLPSADLTLRYRINGGSFQQPFALSQFVHVFDSTFVADTSATTQQLTGGSGSFQAGVFLDASTDVPTTTYNSGMNTEMEYCLVLDSRNIVAGDVIELKMFNPNFSYAMSNSVTATVTASPVRTVLGLSNQVLAWWNNLLGS
jgi:hypothetical protein